MQNNLNQSQENDMEFLSSEKEQLEIVESKSDKDRERQEKFQKKTNLEKMRKEDEEKAKEKKEKSEKLKKMKITLENLKIKLGSQNRKDITAKELENLPELKDIHKELGYDKFTRLTKYLDENLEKTEKKSVLINEAMEIIKKSIK